MFRMGLQDPEVIAPIISPTDFHQRGQYEAMYHEANLKGIPGEASDYMKRSKAVKHGPQVMRSLYPPPAS